MTAAAQPITAAGPYRARLAASAAPTGGVACIAVRSTAKSLPCMAAGTSRIRSVWAQAVIGAETKPSAAMAVGEAGTLFAVSARTIAASASWNSSVSLSGDLAELAERFLGDPPRRTGADPVHGRDQRSARVSVISRCRSYTSAASKVSISGQPAISRHPYIRVTHPRRYFQHRCAYPEGTAACGAYLQPP